MASSTIRREMLATAAAAASLLLILGIGTPAVSAQTTAPPNITDILIKGGQYTTLLSLLTATNLAPQVVSLINSSQDGVTVFAPTNSAFSALPPNALPSLSTTQQTNILLYHVLPKFYTTSELRTASKPLMTAASGANRGGYTIEVIAGSGQVNLSTGVVVVPLGAALNVTRPLAVYSIESVLLPVEIFGAKSPVPAPGPVSGGPSGSGAAGGMIRAGGVLGWYAAVVVGVVSSLLAAV